MSAEKPKRPAAQDGTPMSLESLAPVLFTPARTLDELKQAYSVVHQSYVERGYIERSSDGLRFGFHNLLPETVTFVAVLRQTVIATVTLVEDSPEGLPMDEIYHDELEALRKAGRRLGEVTMLADRRTEFTRTLPMVLALFRMLMDCAIKERGMEELCITLNPRHAEFYQRLLHFVPLGGRKSYPSVQDNPALAMHFGLDGLATLLEKDRQYRSMYEKTELIERSPMEERYRLLPQAAIELVRSCGALKNFTPAQREHLSQLYGPEMLA